MNLTPEQKAIGKGNFQAAIGSEYTRRDFLKGGIAAGVVSGAGLGAMYFGYEKSIGDPLRVGVIGTGDEGSVLLGAVTPSYIQVVAIADIRPYNVWRAFHGDHSSDSALKARPGLMTKYGWKTRTKPGSTSRSTADYHELLADKDIEAVIIALPLHLHAKVAIEAMKAGKHVLTEKLMAHSVPQCKEMARVADQTGKILAVGHQRHYSILYDNAVDTIRRGLIGDMHYIRAQWHRGNLPGHDSWQPPLPDDKMKAAVGQADRRSATRRQVRRSLRLCPRKVAQLQPRSTKIIAQRRGLRLRRPRRCPTAPSASAAGRTDPLAAVEPHGRRPDGRTGQPPARRGRHLHQRA